MSALDDLTEPQLDDPNRRFGNSMFAEAPPAPPPPSRVNSRVNRVRAADLADRGIPTYRNASGDVAPITDETGTALSAFDSRHGIAYDSAGQPKKISYGETGPPKVSDPFADLPSRVNADTGAIEKTGPGGLYQYQGQDPTATRQLAMKAKDQAIAKESALVGRKLTLDEHDLVTGNRELDQSRAALVERIPTLSDTTKYTEGSTLDDVKKGIDEHFNAQYALPEANSTRGWFGKELSPEATAVREKIDAGKADAYSKAENHFALKDRLSQLDDTVASARETEHAQIETLLAHQRGEEGPLDRKAPTGASDQPAPGLYPPESEWGRMLGGHALVPDRVLPSIGAKAPVKVNPTPAADLEKPFGEGDARSYRVGEDQSFHLDPNNMMKGLRQGIDDGIIDPEKAKALTPQLRQVQDAVNEQRAVVDAAGGASQVKALVHGAGIGTSFMVGAGPSAKVGAELGAALAPETLGIAIPAGAIIGGIIGGTLTSFGAKKLVDKLAESDSTIRSFTASAELHPYYDTAGNLISFGAGIPTKGAQALVGLAENTGSKTAVSIAESYLNSSGGLWRTVTNLAEDASIRKAGGASAATVAKAIGFRVAGAATVNVAIDTALNEGAKAMGFQQQGETLPSAVQAALIGAFMSGHGIVFKTYDQNAMADILVRAKGAMNEGKGINTVLSPKEAEAFDAFATELRRKVNTGEIPVDTDAVAGTVRQALQGNRNYGIAAADITGKGGTLGLPEGGAKGGGTPPEPAAPGVSKAPTGASAPTEKVVTGKVIEPSKTPNGGLRSEPIEAPITKSEPIATKLVDKAAQIAGPALVDAKGDVIVSGKVGETHADLMKKALGGPNEDAAVEALANDKQHVFLDSAGNVLDRKAAGKLADKAGQRTGQTGPLHSQHLQDKAPEGASSKSSTQVNLSEESAAPIHKFVKTISEGDLYKGEKGSDSFGDGGYGRETEPHVTALYGITHNDTAAISARVKGHGPVALTLGKISKFSSPDKPYDVLKVDVHSPDLHALNTTLKKEPFESDFLKYQPHLTLAYVKKGAADKYIGDDRFEGQSVTIPDLTFSDATGTKTKIGLTSPNAKIAGLMKTRQALLNAKETPVNREQLARVSAQIETELKNSRKAKPKTKKETNAVTPGKEQGSAQPKLPRIPPGTDVRPHESEIRQEASGQAGGGSRAVERRATPAREDSPGSASEASVKAPNGALPAKSAPTGLTFKTDQGSTYAVDSEGRTQRTKSLHKGHDASDVGLKERSAKTVYVSADFAREVGMWQTMSGTGKRLTLDATRDPLTKEPLNTVGLYSKTNEGLGTRRDPVVNDNQFSTEPKVGLHPLEVWKPEIMGFASGAIGYSSVHPGNKITEIINEPAPLAAPTKANIGGAPKASNDAEVGSAVATGDIEALRANNAERLGPEAARPYQATPDSLMGFSKSHPQKGYADQKYSFVQPVLVVLPDGSSFVEAMKGLNKAHAMERAHRNWDGSKIYAISQAEFERDAGKEIADTAQVKAPDGAIVPTKDRAVQLLEGVLDNKFSQWRTTPKADLPEQAQKLVGQLTKQLARTENDRSKTGTTTQSEESADQSPMAGSNGRPGQLREGSGADDGRAVESNTANVGGTDKGDQGPAQAVQRDDVEREFSAAIERNQPGIRAVGLKLREGTRAEAVRGLAFDGNRNELIYNHDALTDLLNHPDSRSGVAALEAGIVEELAHAADRYVNPDWPMNDIEAVRSGVKELTFNAVRDTYGHANSAAEVAIEYMRMLALVRSGRPLPESFWSDSTAVEAALAERQPDMAEQNVAKMLSVLGWDQKAPSGALASQIDTPEFKRWFGNSKVVDADGKPLIAKHGTARPDRIGTVFRKSRATSGPMAFFTTGDKSGDVASGYAKGKADTSLESVSDYAQWFKIKPRGQRSEVQIDRAWWFLTPTERQLATDRLYTVGYQNHEEGEGPIVPDSESIMGRDSIDWEIRKAKGNALKAAVEIWLNSGSLINDEEPFLDVLKGMGIEGARLDNPHRNEAAVYPVYLKIENPLATKSIPPSVVEALQKSANRQPMPKQGIGADAWDKNTRDPQEWMTALREDIANNRDHAWTSIPDWVTRTLKTFGYDGIHDQGGKFSWIEHQVWIPFEETQVKSAIGNRGTFSSTSRNITHLGGPNAPDGAPDIAHMGGPAALKALKKKLAPGLEILNDVKEGVQSLLLPSAQSPAHLRAAELLGSKLGPMHRRQEASRASFRKDWLTFEKLGVHRDDVPLAKNPGIQFMSDIMQAKVIDPKLQSIASRVQGQFAARVALLEKADAPLEVVREHYFPGMWTQESREAFNGAVEEAMSAGIIGEDFNPNEATAAQQTWIKDRADKLLEDGVGSQKDALQYLTRRPLKGRESFRKQKVFDDIMTGVKFGLRPISGNPIDLVMLKLAEMDKSIMANEVFQALKAKGQLKTIKPSERLPEGWAKVDDKYGTIYAPRPEQNEAERGKMEAKTPYVGLPILGYRIVPEPVADILNNYLSSSLYNNRYFGTLFTGWMGLANALNQTQLGVGSAFHVGFTTMEAQISVGANVVKDAYGLLRGNRSVTDLLKTGKNLFTASIETGLTGDKILNAWRKPDGVIDERIAQVVRAAELAGAGFKLETGLQTDQTSKFVSDWLNGHRLRAARRSPVAFVEMLAKPIMEWIVPRQKAGVFAHLAWRIIEQNPGKSMEKLTPEFRQAWNRIDARLGQVRYDRLFINNTAKNVVQGLVRAPGWSGGTIAELGGSFKDTYKFFEDFAKTGKLPQDVPDRVAYTISLLVTVALINAVLTYALTGEKPDGLDYWAFRTGGKDEHGNPERFVLPTYVKDLIAYVKEPWTTLLNKSHPLLSIFGDLFRNKTFYGVEIRDPDSNALMQAIQSGKYVAKAFTPFWIRGAQKELSQAGLSAKALLPLIGVMPAPRKLTQTSAQELASQINGAGFAAAPISERAAERRQEKSDITSKIRRGEAPDIAGALARGTIKPRDVKALYKRASTPPLAAQVDHMTLENAERVYQRASLKERTELAPVMARKRRSNALKGKTAFSGF